jgi:hypothetical protein
MSRSIVKSGQQIVVVVVVVGRNMKHKSLPLHWHDNYGI